jgi:hypothetical protein
MFEFVLDCICRWGLLLAEYIEQAEMKVVLADLGLSLNVGKSRGISGSMKTDKEWGNGSGGPERSREAVEEDVNEVTRLGCWLRPDHKDRDDEHEE